MTFSCTYLNALGRARVGCATTYVRRHHPIDVLRLNSFECPWGPGPLPPRWKTLPAAADDDQLARSPPSMMRSMADTPVLVSKKSVASTISAMVTNRPSGVRAIVG
jgi:hypothetical protein